MPTPSPTLFLAGFIVCIVATQDAAVQRDEQAGPSGLSGARPRIIRQQLAAVEPRPLPQDLGEQPVPQAQGQLLEPPVRAVID